MLGFENVLSAIEMIKYQIQSRSQGLLNFRRTEYREKSGCLFGLPHWEFGGKVLQFSLLENNLNIL